MAMSRGPGGGGGGRFSRRKKFCRFTAEGVKSIDYKDLGTLKGYGYVTPFDKVHHMALVHGRIGDGTDVPTRLHRANVIQDMFGGAKSVNAALARFKQAGRGVMVVLRDGTAGVHLSFDLDVVDPEDAPGTGTPVWGGITYREAHLAMELLADRAQVVAIDLVEVNPVLDTQNMTGVLAASLSGGQQKIVEFARALMLDPALVILDEPSMGLDPKTRSTVFETIRAMNRAGRTILLVEQNARSGLGLASHGVVLESGRVRLEGDGPAVLNNPEISRLYLGATA